MHKGRTIMEINMRGDIFVAINNYNKQIGRHFSCRDTFVICTVLSDAYTTDQDLSKLAACSLSTVKRSINKLCDFGILEKHIAPDHTKTLTVKQAELDAFLSQYGSDT